MTQIIDAFGKYSPIFRCECIDERTLTNLNHSLTILYKDKMREQEEFTNKDVNKLSSEEREAININRLVIPRTKSLIEILKEIKPCK